MEIKYFCLFSYLINIIIAYDNILYPKIMIYLEQNKNTLNKVYLKHLSIILNNFANVFCLFEINAGDIISK